MHLFFTPRGERVRPHWQFVEKRERRDRTYITSCKKKKKPRLRTA